MSGWDWAAWIAAAILFFLFALALYVYVVGDSNNLD